MEQPIYVLKAHEVDKIPEGGTNQPFTTIKIIIWIIIVLILFFSLIFKDNFFDSMSWTTRSILIMLAIGSLFMHKKQIVTPLVIEIQFYKEYLIVFRNKVFYSSKIKRREFYKFYYRDIKSINFDVITKRMNIEGLVEDIWYNYNSDGTLPIVPTYHMTVDSLCYFYILDNDVQMVLSIIENYSGFKIQLRNKKENNNE